MWICMLGWGVMCTSLASAQQESVSGVSAAKVPVLSEEMAQAIAEIKANMGGTARFVECNGTYGYDNIQDAIEDSVSGDIVVVFPRNFDGIECDDDHYFIGPEEHLDFQGKAITVQSILPDNPDYVEHTIVLAPPAFRTPLSFENGEGPDSILDGLTLLNVGPFCNGSSPTIRNCTLRGLGIMATQGSNPLIQNCSLIEIVQSHSMEERSVIHCRNSDVTVQNSTIFRSVEFGVFAEQNSNVILQDCTVHEIRESGIYAKQNSNVALNNCHIHDNHGGGIYITENSSLSADGCTISNNESYGVGGVYLEEGSSASLFNSSIINNKSIYGNGGGIYHYGPGDLTIGNCIIAGNDGTGHGGGIFAMGFETIQISNSVIARNVARQGGGLYLSTSSENQCTITNSTVADNTATASFYPGINLGGGGIFTFGYTVLDLENTILWGNVYDDHVPQQIVAHFQSEIEVNYSDVEDKLEGIKLGQASVLDWGCGNIGLDPGFVDDDYHIDLYSLVRNAGDPDYVPLEGETDIDGEARVQEGRIDMGADEFVGD